MTIAELIENLNNLTNEQKQMPAMVEDYEMGLSEIESIDITFNYQSRDKEKIVVLR